MLPIAERKEKREVVAVLSPGLGHVLIHLSPNKSISTLPLSRGYEWWSEVNEDAKVEAPESAPSPLDEAVAMMQQTSTDLWARYVEQLNVARVASDHIDNSVLSRVLQAYLVVWIVCFDVQSPQLASVSRVKREIHEESVRSTQRLEELKTASDRLKKEIQEVETTNSELQASAEATFQKQQALEACFMRVIQVRIERFINRRNYKNVLKSRPFRKCGT